MDTDNIYYEVENRNISKITNVRNFFFFKSAFYIGAASVNIAISFSVRSRSS